MPIVPVGATQVKLYHSTVPHENSAFQTFAYVSLKLYCERFSCFLSIVDVYYKVSRLFLVGGFCK